MLGLIIHSTKGRSCMREVISTLSAVKAPMTIAELRMLTSQRWDVNEISSVLAKLVKRGAVVQDEDGLDATGKRQRRTWKWIAT